MEKSRILTRERMTVRLDFIEDLLGSWPADPEIFSRFVASKAPSQFQADEEKDEIDSRSRETGLTVFPQDDVGLHFFNYHIKGFLKEAGNNLKLQLGTKNLRSKIDNYVFISPRKLYLYRNGKIIEQEDEMLERPLRAETLKGPRMSLVSSEVVKTPCSLTFTLQLIYHPEIDREDILTLLEYGVLKGLGQWRNSGLGSFNYTITSSSSLPESEYPKPPATEKKPAKKNKANNEAAATDTSE